MSPIDRTTICLERWHQGDENAVRELVERDAPWVLDHVRRRLGAGLRKRVDSVDVVQEAMLEVLRYAPRFVAPDQARFRGLMVRIVENVLREQHRFFHARRRAMSREADGATAAALQLSDSGASPSGAAVAREDQRWLRLGLELLGPEDRKIIVLRQWDEMPFDEVGRSLGVTEDAARMRFRRALARLARKVKSLRDGTWADTAAG